jgi:hypothetical protein
MGYASACGPLKILDPRVMINGNRCDIGLGPYPGVTLATARKLANEHRD